MFAQQAGTILHQFLVLGAEGGGEMAVNIEFADHFAAHKTGTTISDLVSIEQAR